MKMIKDFTIFQTEEILKDGQCPLSDVKVTTEINIDAENTVNFLLTMNNEVVID